MGLMSKVKELLGQHDDKVDEAIDKAAEVAKEQLPGQKELIDGVAEEAKAATGDGDTTAQATPETPASDTTEAKDEAPA
jgi:hypothetical protein